jgi:hypothetical protein
MKFIGLKEKIEFLFLFLHKLPKQQLTSFGLKEFEVNSNEREKKNIFLTWRFMIKLVYSVNFFCVVHITVIPQRQGRNNIFYFIRLLFESFLLFL